MFLKPLRLVLLMQTLIASFGLAQQPPDACSDVLRIGLRDTYNRSFANSLTASLDYWNSHDESKEFWDSHKNGFDVGVDGFSIGTNNQGTSGGTHHISNKEDFKSFLSQQTAELLASSVLSPVAPAAISAWQQCIAVGRKSMGGMNARVENYDPEGNRFDVHFTWIREPYQKSAPAINGPLYLENLDCDNCIAELANQWWRPSFMPRPVPEDVILRFRRKISTVRSEFTFTTDQGPLHPVILIPPKANKPSGKCSSSCSKCVEEQGRYMCSECTTQVIIVKGQDHSTIAEHQSDLPSFCFPMAAGSQVSIEASGTVWPDGSTIGGLKAGDPGVLWWIVTRLVSNPASSEAAFAQSQIAEKKKFIRLSGTSTVPESESVSTTFRVDHVSMWPDTHGSLALGDDFKVVIRSLSK